MDVPQVPGDPGLRQGVSDPNVIRFHLKFLLRDPLHLPMRLIIPISTRLIPRSVSLNPIILQDNFTKKVFAFFLWVLFIAILTEYYINKFVKANQPAHTGNPYARTPWVREDCKLALWLWEPVAVPYLLSHRYLPSFCKSRPQRF